MSTALKNVAKPVDWLRRIDGLKVSDAIEYLATLPQDHTLNYWQSSGDDQGVEISSELQFLRPYTKQELAEIAAERTAKRISGLKASIAYYEKTRDRNAAMGYTSVAESYQRDVDRMRQQLKELST